MLKHYVDNCLKLVKTLFLSSVRQDVFMLLVWRCPVYSSNNYHCMEIKKPYENISLSKKDHITLYVINSNEIRNF